MTTRPHPTPAEEDEDGCMLTNRQFWLCGGACLLFWLLVFTFAVVL